LNRRRRSLNSVPHRLSIIPPRVSVNFIPLLITWSIYTLNLSLLSNITPRYRIVSIGIIMISFISNIVLWGDLLLEKWISIYLDFSNYTPCLLLQSSALLMILSNFIIFRIVLPLLIPYPISSIYPRVRVSGGVISSRSLLYRMYRIGDSDDPYGISIDITNDLDFIPLNLSYMIRFWRKLSVHLINISDILYIYILYNNLLWYILLKVSDISMKIMENIFPSFHII
jgi:hypothetical protein